MTTKARKRWSWVVMVGMGVFVLGVGYWANGVHQESLRVQAERDEQARRAELIVQSAPIPLIMCGEEARITVTNPAAEAMFGYDSSELIGQKIYKLIPPEIAYDHDKVFRSAEARARARPERRYAMYKDNIKTLGLHSSGERIPIIMSIRVIKYGGDVEFIATMRPNTEPDGPALPEPPPTGIELPDLEQRMQSRMKAAK